MNYIDSYIQAFEKNYPESFKSLNIPETKYLISDKNIHLKESDFRKIKDFIETLFKVSRSEEYKDSISSDKDSLKNFTPKNYSVLMCYDFHITLDGPKLIEINTNASNFLISDLLYKSYFSERDHLSDLIHSFKEECSLKNIPMNESTIAIIDDNPPSQKGYIEFLMYQELLKDSFSDVFICDFQEIDSSGSLNGKKIDFIYNRHTDFYFNNSPILKELYFEKKCVFSPQPKEYLLLSDKNRLVDLTHSRINLTPDTQKKILPILIPTHEMKSFDKEELWKNKKNYFFKPKNSFGSKSTYKGKSISKKNFERMFEEDSLAQDYRPAPSICSSSEENLKYDLRVYAYQDRIQMISARVYAGQTTNFRNLNGGLARVEIV